MAEIYLVRHGETEWNAQGRFQGQLDSPLTQLGISQAQACGQRIAQLGIVLDQFLASPLGRTRQTASIIAACGPFPEVRFDARLSEASVGSWDGLTHTEITARWPGSLEGTSQFDWFFRSPDCESYEAILARTEDWLSGLQGKVLAVSHGLLGRFIRGAYLGLPREDALCLPVPQDIIWHLANGQVKALPVS